MSEDNANNPSEAPDAEESEGLLLIGQLQRQSDSLCITCHRPLCLHQILGSIALGAGKAPRCLDCLARALEQDPADLAKSLLGYIEGRPCYLTAWQWASQIEAVAWESIPPCMLEGRSAVGAALNR